MKSPFTLLASTALVVAFGATLAGCRGDISKSPPIHPNPNMDFQPKFRAQAEATFSRWTDGRAMRAPVPGTVARNRFTGDPEHLLRTYDQDGDQALSRTEVGTLWAARTFALVDSDDDGRLVAAELQTAASLHSYRNDDGSFLAENPLRADAETVGRGRDRFNIYCAACHGQTGDGGLVAKRWPVKVPSLVADVDQPTRERLVGMAPGELFSVITEGKGTMPSYGHQIPAEDRWAIIHYLKALQRHFN